ncbi:AMP nucleosidase [Escherichia coli]|nr:AMP nucleosidase [Escherichia coli]
MLPSETMIWQPEFTDKTLSRKPGAVQRCVLNSDCDRFCSRHRHLHRKPYG